MAITAVNLDDRENLLLAARMTHDNQTIKVAEVLNETNDVIADAITQRANDITSHVIARRTRLPAVNWVKVGNGWNATTGLLNQVREQMGMLKARFLAPEDVMRIQANPAMYRANQERAYIESMGQEFSNTFFGNWAAGSLSPAVEPPEEFAGLSLRYNTLSTAQSSYVISNGNTAGNDNTSIWFVQWAMDKIYTIFPRNTVGGGIKKQDMGLVYTLGDNASATASQRNNQLWAFISEFSWDIGICIEDTRAVKRLCNIDTVRGQTFTLNEDFIIQIKNNFRGNETVFMYVNETVFTQLEILAKDKANVRWESNTPFGESQLMFGPMPVRRSDAITDVEGIIA
ncbi:hypothetical protein LCGC14_1070780 [marine sediment metagenome]|uniref:Major capsid protein n=1 Tax=marine sediment metagenome TaxID=412755 RepID=A0A0F9QP42_9ZZZZ